MENFNYPDPNAQYEEEGETMVFAPQGNPQPTFTVPQVDQSLVEAERRIAKANCYKMLLHEPFFDSQNVVTQEVEREVRAFVKGRFEELLGMGRPADPGGLSEDDVVVLKALAEAARRRQSTASQLQPVALPVQAPVPTGPRRRTVKVPKEMAAPVVVAPKQLATVRRRKTPVDQYAVPQTISSPPLQASPPVPPAPKPPVNRRPSDKEVIERVDSNGMRTIRKGHKRYQEMVDPTGTIRVLDITQQTRPGPNDKQPIPSLSPQMQAAAMQQHAVQQVGNMQVIDTALTERK